MKLRDIFGLCFEAARPEASKRNKEANASICDWSGEWQFEAGMALERFHKNGCCREFQPVRHSF